MNLPRLTVSLTTYGQRIYTVDRTIESILNQTRPPDQIILWLDEGEFKEGDVPNKLRSFCESKLSIKFCKNLRSYNKLIPSLKEIKVGLVVTIDDDFVYSDNLLSDLLRCHLLKPRSIVCARARIMLRKSTHEFAPYPQWALVQNSSVVSAKSCLLPLGYAGVLYPVELLNKEIMNSEAFARLAPTADDIWFKCMAVKSGLPTIVLPSGSSSRSEIIKGTQEGALFLNENTNDINGEQLMAILNEYPDLKSIFFADEFNHIQIDSEFLVDLLDSRKYDVRGLGSADVLRDVALLVEDKNLPLARRFMRAARRLRPNGKIINGKLREYKRRLERRGGV